MTMNSNLALGLFCQIFLASNVGFSQHILLALKSAFSSNKKLYNKELKLFSLLQSQTRSESKENFEFPHTPRKQKKLEWTPQSEQLKHAISLGTQMDFKSRTNTENVRSAISQKQITARGRKLGLIMGDNTSISSGSKAPSLVPSQR